MEFEALVPLPQSPVVQVGLFLLALAALRGVKVAVAGLLECGFTVKGFEFTVMPRPGE